MGKEILKAYWSNYINTPNILNWGHFFNQRGHRLHITVVEHEFSSTDTFEDILKRGRSQLNKARTEYQSLEGMDDVPDKLVEAIGDLERELDELDQNLEVTDDDIRLAKETVARVSVLAELFGGLKKRQQVIVDGACERVDRYVEGLQNLFKHYNVPDDIKDTVESIEHRHSMLEKLVSGDRYGQILSNEQVDPDSIVSKIHTLTDKLSESTTAIDRTEFYLGVCGDVLDDIHARLAELKEDNEDRLAHSAELQEIKQKKQTAESKLSKSPDEAVSTANIVLENCLSLHQDIVVDHADQKLVVKLATVCQDEELAIDHNIENSVARGDPESLLVVIADTIASEVDLSTSGRLLQLLQEHDGSVVRTKKATHFDITTILNHLTQLYDEEEIADINVEFTK